MQGLKLVFIALIASAGWGCQSSAAPAQADVKAKAAAARSELADKIRGMSPAERRAYLQTHPEEVQRMMKATEGDARPAPK